MLCSKYSSGIYYIIYYLGNRYCNLVSPEKKTILITYYILDSCENFIYVNLFLLYFSLSFTYFTIIINLIILYLLVFLISTVFSQNIV